MDKAAREAAVDALIALSLSPDYRDRLDAGAALASFVESGPASDRLGELVLDPDDTAATRWTVDALMRRRDAAALEVIAAALPSADCDHARWIDSGIRDALGWAEWTWAEALEVCDELPETAGSSQLSGLLSELKPDKQTGW